MKKMFSPFAIAISAVVFITTACSKESVDKPELQPQGVAAIAGIPVSKAQVTYDSRTGTYVSSYGGGISFGGSQPHPTTPDPSGTYDGQPIPVNYVTWRTSSSGSLYSTSNGGYFSILESTSPGAVTVDQLSKYFKNLQNYYKYPDSIAYPAPLGTTTGAGGVREVRGLLVRDHTSPTLMAVVSDTYVYRGPGSNLPTKPWWFGEIEKNGYLISFFGPTFEFGYVDRLEMKYNGVVVTPASFSLTYKSNAPEGWIIVGTITMADGTVISINDVVMA